MAKKKKDKRTNNDLQNITQKTIDRATRTGSERRCCSTCGTRRDPLVTNPVISLELVLSKI